MDYTYKILTELQTLENLSEEYKQELLFLTNVQSPFELYAETLTTNFQKCIPN